jgi:TetR/AcrR family transcriptional regulator, fatty acid metabolism regulator protein
MALRATKLELAKDGTSAVVQPRSVGQWGAREAGILDVAAQLYASRGYESVSMSDVARAAGLSEGTLYNYFRDKTDLVVSVGLVALEANIAGAAAITKNASSLDDGLRQLIAHQLRCMLAEPEMYRIWLREVKAVESYGKGAARDALRRFSQQFIFFLDRWHPHPETLRLPPALMRDMFYGGIEQIGWTAIVQGRPVGRSGSGQKALDIDGVAASLAASYLDAFGLSPARAVRFRKQTAPTKR